jgi:hypothetical protein
MLHELPPVDLTVIERNPSTIVVEMPLHALQTMLNWCVRHVEGGWESIRTWRIDLLVDQTDKEVQVCSRLFIPKEIHVC